MNGEGEEGRVTEEEGRKNKEGCIGKKEAGRRSIASMELQEMEIKLE